MVLLCYNIYNNKTKSNKIKINSADVEKEKLTKYYEKLINRYSVSNQCDGNTMLISKNGLTKYEDISKDNISEVVLEELLPKPFLPIGDENEGPIISISKKLYEEEYENFWGPKYKPKYENLHLNLGNKVDVTDKYIDIYPVGGYDSGCSGYENQASIDIDNVVENDNESIITIKYLYFEITDGSTDKLSKVKIYKDVEKTTLIAEEELEKTDDYKLKLKDKYSAKAGNYKLTFKNNELGNLYWFSTEMVK